MYSFFGSGNSRFFLVQKGTEISLYREGVFLWKKEIPHGGVKILGVGNNGLTAAQSEEGIYLYPPSGEDPRGPLEQFSRRVLAESSSYLGKVGMDEKGSQLCLEKVSLESKLGEKIFGVLASVPVEKGLERHEIIFYDIVARTQRLYYKVSISRKLEKKFLWDISDNFNFMVIAEPQRSFHGVSVKFAIIHVPFEEIYHELSLNNPDYGALIINNDGTLFIDRAAGQDREFLIVTKDAERFKVTPPSNYEIIHLGKKFVALKTISTPAMIVKSLENTIVCYADLKVLDDLVLSYQILFNNRDEIDFAYIKDNEFHVMQSSIDRFVTDAKRWELMAEQAKKREAEHVREIQEKERERQSVGSMVEGRALALKHELARAREERARQEVGERGEILRRLEGIKLRYVTGQIREDEYLSLCKDLEGKLKALESAPPTVISSLGPPDERPLYADPKLSPEKRKIEQLLEKLEERFIMGEISEESYRELRDRYRKKLQDIS